MNCSVGSKWLRDDRRRGSHDEKLILLIQFCLYFKKKNILIFCTSAIFTNYRQ